MKGKSEAKTPQEYIEALEEPRRIEIEKIHETIRATLPDLEPFMISGMIGYGPYRFKYASGREGDWCRIALASQKSYISLYCCGIDEQGYIAERYKERLPNASIGKSCVRFKRLDDLDRNVLEALLKESAASPMGM